MLMTQSDSLEATVTKIASAIIISLRSSILFACLICFFVFCFLHKDLSQGSRDTRVTGLPLKSLQ